MTQARPGNQCILRVGFEGIERSENTRDSSLRIVRIRFRAFFFCNDKDTQLRSMKRQLNGKKEPGTTGPKDENVSVRRSVAFVNGAKLRLYLRFKMKELSHCESSFVSSSDVDQKYTTK